MFSWMKDTAVGCCAGVGRMLGGLSSTYRPHYVVQTPTPTVVANDPCLYAEQHASRYADMGRPITPLQYAYLAYVAAVPPAGSVLSLAPFARITATAGHRLSDLTHRQLCALGVSIATGATF